MTTIADAQANLRTTLKRGENFLRMAALLAVLLAGVAVALAAQRFARRKTEEVALLRCLGASRIEILLALLLELGLAVLIGFALPPLLRLRDVEPMRVFRQDMQTRLRRFDVLYLLPLAVSAGLLMTQSNSLTLALVLACGLFAVGLLASLFTLGALGLFATRSQAADATKATPVAKPSLTVSLTRPQAGMVPVTLSANGSVAAWQEASVGTETGRARCASGWPISADASA